MEEEKSQQPQQFYSPASSSSRKSSKKFLLFFIILVVVGVVSAVLFFSTRGSTEEEEEKLTPTPTEFQFPTDTPSPSPAETEESPTPEPTNTPTPRPTSNPIDKATGLDRSKLTVQVSNGSGGVGVAAKAADLLKSLGYNVTSTGNADNYDYQNTVIDVKSPSSKYLDLLKKDLGASYSIGSTSASLSSDAPSDARIIVGKQ